MHMTQWKKAIWKGYILHDSNYMTFWKKQNYGDNKKISGCWQGRWQGGHAEHRGFSEQCTYSEWYYNDGYMSLYIRPNPQNIQPHEWTLIQTRDFGWLWCVNVGSSSVANAPLWQVMLIMGEAVRVWVQGVYGKSLNLPLNFAVNLKLH